MPWPKEAVCGVFEYQQFQQYITLPFFILGSHYKKTPLLYLSGGPGSAAGVGKSYLPHWLNWMDYTNLDRPLIIIDLPGTGNAKPQFVCKQLNEFNHWQLAAGLDAEELLEQSYGVLKKCRALQMQAGDFSWLNTSNTAAILNEFINQLEFEKINIYALSFGGRIAVEIDRIGNKKIQKYVLDSPYPIGRNLLEDWPEIFANAITMITNSCQKNCQKSPEQTELQLKTILTDLESSPIKKQLDVSGVPQSISLSPSVLIDTLFFSLYNSSNRNKIYLALDELQQPNNSQNNLNALLSQYVALSLDESFNLMTYYSLSCSGQKEVSEGQYRRGIKRYSEKWSKYIESEVRFNVCDIWPVEKEAKDYFKKLKNRTETLVLLGGLDPVVLPNWFAQQAANPALTIQLFPDASHVLLNNHYCAQQWVQHFLDEDIKSIDRDCEGFFIKAKN